MNFNEYQQLAARTINQNQSWHDKICNFALGLSGETGETVDYLKKVLFHRHEMDRENVKKELGDILWYVSSIANTLKITLEDVAKMNIEKLMKRYPNGFEFDKSINRTE